MSSSLLTIAITMTLGQVPIGGNPSAIPYNASSGMNGAPASGVYSAPNSTGAFNSGDQLLPFDAYPPWAHGHFQTIPSYGGFHYYRPYNYKHLLAQSQVSGGWGMPATMPYSHEYFRRGREMALYEQAPAGSGPANQAAEYARWRAQQDFLRRTENAQNASFGRAPQGTPVYQGQGGYYDASGAPPVDAAVYSRSYRTDDRQQNNIQNDDQFRALQQAAQQENQRQDMSGPRFYRGQ